MTPFATLSLGFVCGAAAALIHLATQQPSHAPKEPHFTATSITQEIITPPLQTSLPNTQSTPSSLNPSTLSQLATFDASAFEQAETSLERELLLRVVDSLMESDPSKAAALLLSITPDSRNGLYRSIAIEWARKQPEAALAWFTTHGSSLDHREYTAALDGLWHSYAHRDPAAAERRFHELETQPPLESFYTFLAEGWAKSNPSAGLNWLTNLDPFHLSAEALNDAYTTLIRAYIPQDISFATSLPRTLEDPALRQELFPEIAGQLAEQNLQSAINWVKELANDPSAAPALGALTASLSPEDDSLALDIALEFTELFASESSLPTDTLSLIASRNPQIIASRIKEIPATAQAFLGERLAEHWLNQDPKITTAPPWLSQLPPGPAFDTVVAAKALSDPSQNAPDSLHWAAQISAPSKRIETLREVIHSANLSQLPEVSKRITLSTLNAEEKESLQQTLHARSDHAAL